MKSQNEIRSALLIEKKVKRYIRRFYDLKIAYGLITLIISVVFSGLISFLIDFLFKPSFIADRILFFSFLLLNLYVLVRFVFIPFLKRTGLIKGLDYREAGKAISERNNEVRDNIENILELEKERIPDNILYDYAIDQKSEKIKWLNFNKTISLKSVLNQGIKALIAIAVIVIISFIWPDFIPRGYQRVVIGNNSISQKNIYEFEILNKELRVESGKDFELKFRVNPEVREAFVKKGERSERAMKTGDYFTYVFKAINNEVNFRLSAEDATSKSFVIKIQQKPEISRMVLNVIPAGYTGVSPFSQENDGNIEVPEGSEIEFEISTTYCDSLLLVFGDTVICEGNKQNWNYKGKFVKSQDYIIALIGTDGINTEYYYRINVVNDLFPEIEIRERFDSLFRGGVVVEGSIQDDYGFSRLVLIGKRAGNEAIKEITINQGSLYQNFYEVIEPDTNETEYFFRIWDNDRNNGPKFSDSRKIYLKTKTKEEIGKENKELAEKVNKQLEEGVNSIDKLEEKIMQFRMERIAGSLKPWEIQEKMKEINQMKDELVSLIEGIQKENQEFTDNVEFLNEKEELTEKAKEIEELLKNLIDDELKELLEQFEKLAKEFNEREANEATEKMEINMEKLKEQMDMGLEMLKKLSVEKEIMNSAEKLEELGEKIEKEQNTNDTIAKNNKEEFEKWEEEFEKALRENEELKEPMKLENKGKERESIREDLEKAKSGNSSQKKENSKKAASEMKELANDIREMMAEEKDASEMVDIEELRQIRNSLNDFSKTQESVNEEISNVTTANPIYAENIKKQKELQEKFGKIRDSLKSIGYKQPMVAKMLGQEMFHVETSFRSLFQSFEDNRIQQIRVEQNRIMSEVNIMVLKLDELIKSAENQKGTGSGSKGFTDSKRKDKGDNKGSEQIGQTKAQQESLKEQLKSAIQQMKQGKAGAQGRKELSKMLGEREMMRRATEKLTQGGMLGKDAKERLQQALEMMREVEKDIIYNRLGDHTVEKDEWIRTRLLEAENAERERENENRRESREFKGEIKPNTIKLDLPEEQNNLYRQSLKYRELKLKKYYQDKYEEYLKTATKK